METIANEAARKQRLEALYADKACARCGETNIEMLGCYSRIDLHHVAARSYDPDLVVYLCRNCHAVAQAQLKEIGVVDLAPKTKRNLLDVLAVVLRAVGCTLKDWGERFMAYGEQLIEFIRELDEKDASWRELPAAQL